MSISTCALREEGDLYACGYCHTCKQFLSTPSARRATRPALRGGEQMRHFYPRPPQGGRLPGVRRWSGRQKISIHALREEGDLRQSLFGARDRISIHALREEGDLVGIHQRSHAQISIRALREEGDTPIQPVCDDVGIFLSTPSARRATLLDQEYGGC